MRCEPDEALFAGEDGLDVIRGLIQAAVRQLKPDGTLMFEFAFGHDDAVVQLISATAGLTMVGLRHDLQEIPRIAIATRTIETR